MLTVTVAISVVGAVDAGIGGNWDLAVVFVLIAVLQLLLLLRLARRRPAVPLRADLVRWLLDRASSEGESAQVIADRAVGAYRDDLLGADHDVPADRGVHDESHARR